MSPDYRYFSAKEITGLKHDLISMLDKARDLYGGPIIITSGYRTPEQNKKAGGVTSSAHVAGLAVDIRAPKDAAKKKALIAALRQVGFIRIGVYDKHLHVDIDRRKPQVAWAGGASHA